MNLAIYKRMIYHDQIFIPKKNTQQIRNGFLNIIKSSYKILQLTSCLLMKYWGGKTIQKKVKNMRTVMASRVGVGSYWEEAWRNFLGWWWYSILTEVWVTQVNECICQNSSNSTFKICISPYENLTSKKIEFWLEILFLRCWVIKCTFSELHQHKDGLMRR